MALAAGTVWAAPEDADAEIGTAKAGQVVTKAINAGKATQPVPNSALTVVDPDTLTIIEAKWEHLYKTMNRSYRHQPLEADNVRAEDVRPWTPPADGETPSAFLRGADPLTLEVNGEPSSAAPGGFSSTVNEPSVGAIGDYVFYTGNWYAAASTDGGTSWSFVNPFSGPFPEPAGQGFCCDQQVHVDPDANVVFWLQQMIPDGSTDEGTQRVNVDRGANGTWDCFYDVTPQDAGFNDNTFPDYPDFSVSDEHLFVTSNVFPSGTGGFQGAFVARLPLDDITTCNNTSVDFFTSAQNGSFRTTQGASDTMYFADLVSTTSIRVWSWPDASATPTSVVRTVNAFLFNTRVCLGPDARDWCGFIDSRIFGAAVGDDRVIFLWSPSQNPIGGFPFPYTQGVILDASNDLDVVEQPLIWSVDAAWVYPSIASNSNGDFGGTVMWGGGTFFPNCSAYVVDDQNGDSFSPFEHEVVINGSTGPSQNRSGDYLSTRVNAPNDLAYSGSCFAYPSTGSSDSRYVLFGRSSIFQQGSIFDDGFEIGNTSLWSDAVP